MAASVQETSHTYNWFFLFYRFGVGVLFAQLTVGILIATFGEVSTLDASAAGEILHEFRGELEVLPHEAQVAFVKGLGIPAQFSLDTTPDIDFTTGLEPCSHRDHRESGENSKANTKVQIVD
jgi:hypothetical protein